ncbi:MAG: DUF1569 domain-containing protein [Saprospiraceae bacterium]|nr:DUF1569 domain-containing protein [Saprospiraceae bacterium]
MQRPLIMRNLGEVLDFLQLIEDGKEISVQGAWDLDQHLIHCAHSIEFAMSGYPSRKPLIFQNTIGTLVFHYFDWRNYMRHPTNAFNPGESDEDIVVGQCGIERLKETIASFDAWDGPMQRHRFYGHLTKKQYDKVNAMHIANHLELVEF